jgi:hypothetical protein
VDFRGILGNFWEIALTPLRYYCRNMCHQSARAAMIHYLKQDLISYFIYLFIYLFKTTISSRIVYAYAYPHTFDVLFKETLTLDFRHCFFLLSNNYA